MPGGPVTVHALVPRSELSGYQARLHGMTGGHGRCTRATSHFDAVPAAVWQQLVAQPTVRDDD